MQFRLLNIEIKNNGIEYRKYDDGSYQLNACTIIEKIYKKMPEDAYCLLAITDVDLYNDYRVIKPRKWIYYPPPYKNDFCYELNSYKYWVGFCSIARYDPMFTKDEQPSESEKANFFFKLLKRSIKMVVKNIGHMFGLKNCIFFSCVMNGFGNMKEFDSRPVEICPCCLRKIFTNIVRKYSRLDDGKRVTEKDILIFQRFDKIRNCLKENFKGIFDRELEWYEKRFNSLNKELYGE
jgi:predicted Zn-dependent protease